MTRFDPRRRRWLGVAITATAATALGWPVAAQERETLRIGYQKYGTPRDDHTGES